MAEIKQAKLAYGTKVENTKVGSNEEAASIGDKHGECCFC
jgi:hypothetical protein